MSDHYFQPQKIFDNIGQAPKVVDRYENDLVKAPNHYTTGGLEVKTILQAKLSPEEFRGYCKGNVIKYLMRAEHKGNPARDYAKAAEYANWLAEKNSESAK